MWPTIKCNISGMAVSAGLLSSPIWSIPLKEWSEIGSVISVWIGVAVGLATLVKIIISIQKIK